MSGYKSLSVPPLRQEDVTMSAGLISNANRAVHYFSSLFCAEETDIMFGEGKCAVAVMKAAALVFKCTSDSQRFVI